MLFSLDETRATYEDDALFSSLFDHDHALHIMTRHVAQVREASGTCRRELKLNQALRRDDHSLESVWTELRSPVAAQVEVDTEEELLGHHGMEFRIMVAEP